MKVTVAICTWNRCNLLDQTLEAMHHLHVPKEMDWEILVVTNNCTDDTEKVIAKHVKELPLRQVEERKQGHSHARNCALDHTDANWVVWTDDDVLVEPQWLSSFHETCQRFPEANAMGGPIDPWFPQEPDPDLLAAFPVLRFGFCGIDHGPEERELRPEEDIWGANMAYRMDRLGKLRFNPDLGRKQNTLVSGDDLEFLARVRATGARVVWSPKMRLKHYVEPKRMTLEYLCQFYEGLGTTSVRSGTFPPSRTLWGLPLWVVRKYMENSLLIPLYRCTGNRARLLPLLRDYHRFRGVLKASWDQKKPIVVSPSLEGGRPLPVPNTSK